MKIDQVVNKQNIIIRLLTFLDVAPADEVYTLRELEQLLQCRLDGGQKVRRAYQLADYREKVQLSGNNPVCFFGSKPAILALRQRLSKERDEDENF